MCQSPGSIYLHIRDHQNIQIFPLTQISIRNCERSEFLLYQQALTCVCNNFIGNDKKHKISVSETLDFVPHRTENSLVSYSCHFPCSSNPTG